MREIIKTLRKLHIKTPDAVAITASTGTYLAFDPAHPSDNIFSIGIAACNIGGVTIHSFAGIGLGIESAEELTTKIRKNKKASARWQRTKVLIIDEGLSHIFVEISSLTNCTVSMVDGDLFDKLAMIGSKMRRNAEPFGGIQVN